MIWTSVGTARVSPWGVKGENIALFARIALLAQVADLFFMRCGAKAAVAEVEWRSGRWFDPRLVASLQVLGHEADVSQATARTFEHDTGHINTL